MAVVLSNSTVWDLGPSILEAARQRVRRDGWQLSEETVADLEAIASAVEELKKLVPQTGRPRFRERRVDSMTVVDVATYASDHGVSESYVRRMCRSGKLSAYRESDSWRIVIGEI